MITASALAPLVVADPPSFVLDRAGFFTGPYMPSGGGIVWSGSPLFGQDRVLWNSTVYQTAPVFFENTGWAYTDHRTTLVGLTDSDHTAPDGLQNSSPTAINQAGQFIGSSSRYVDSTGFGDSSAWAYLGTLEDGPTRLGFTDAVHTAGSGAQSSRALGINSAGQIVGTSLRYNGATDPASSSIGRSAWLYTGGLTARLGLTDAQHTGAGGLQLSGCFGITDAGLAAGLSSRFVAPLPGTASDTTVWVYDSSTAQTTLIGLRDAEHTRADGLQSSTILTMVGRDFAGHSQRFQGSASAGQTAWMYDHSSGQTSVLGLTGPGYVSPTGSMSSAIGNGQPIAISPLRPLNHAGQVVGVSTRYPATGTTTLGRDTWLYSAGVTTPIGLSGPEFTSSSGQRSSSPLLLGDSGTVVGVSTRYAASGQTNGGAVWAYRNSVSVPIELTGPTYTSATGGRSGTALAMNGRDQVVGYQSRYEGQANPLGLTGWFYDAPSGALTALDFAQNTSGQRSTVPQYVTDSGWVLGAYSVDPTDSLDFGQRAFFWSEADGFRDLSSLAVSGPAAANWMYLSSIVGVSPDGRTIVCQGRSAGDLSDLASVFVLTIPASSAVLPLALCCVFVRRRR